MSKLQFSFATAPGRSAIATIVVYGDNALAIARQVFRARNRKLQLANSMGRVVYGHWINNGDAGEDLVVCPIAENHFEVHCHGSIAAMEIIADTLRKHGADQVGSKELASHIAGSNYFADLLLATTQASTPKTAKILLKQQRLHRNFWRTIRGIADEELAKLALPLIDSFLAFERFGIGLTRPLKVVFCGAPNAGKSSLVNAILGFNRAIVHDSAGTTRDAVSEVTVIEGWPMILTDTAGIRDSSDKIEEQGIRITRQSIAQADLTVLVFDLANETDPSITHQIGNVRPDLVVGNKLDLAPAEFAHWKLRVSATERTNIDLLMRSLVDGLIPECPPESQAIAVTDYQFKLSRKIRKSIEESDFAAVTESIHSILGK